VEILKQGQYKPMKVEKQIAIIYCGTQALLKQVPVGKVKEFEVEFLELLELSHSDVLKTLSNGIIDEGVTKVLEKVAADLSNKYSES
jgi:F-type H+-transporting ATPase subunit alpha